MYNTEFERILEASKKNSLTLFVGAGVSKLSGAPRWSELIDTICDELGCDKKKSYNSDDYLRIPQMFYYAVGKNDRKYYSFINRSFNSDDLKPNIIHKMMLDLAPISFITTNFDDLLEKASVQHCCSYKVIACDKEISQINGDKYILKIHGDLKHKNIVLKEEDYLNYSENFKLIETLLKSIFSTNTVVMIGYGLNDYNIKLILNWAKSLLQDHFNKPIFIYTDDEKLSEEELTYHESRGLSVIEYYKCDGFVEMDNIEKFENRYKTVIKAINDSEYNLIDGKTKEELFDVLFTLLNPLDAMWALKPEDVQKKLHPYAIVTQNGELIIPPDKPNIFQYFLELNQMDKPQFNTLSKEVKCKYYTIISVFSKSEIFICRGTNKGQVIYRKLLEIEYSFADNLCLHFDYLTMHRYVKKASDSLHENYKKAFYLAKLSRYPEAHELFYEVATKSFKEKNYLLYYLAQVNRRSVYLVLKKINSHFLYHNFYNMEQIELNTMTSKWTERMFENLPLEVQKTYDCFENLHSANLLYKNAYESFVEGKKLQNSIDNNVIEWGLTSVDKVCLRINRDLHFILGNGLYLDEYSEFQNAIAYLMELIVFKHSVQDKIYSDEMMIWGNTNEKVYFNYVDFYCFVQYFSPKDLELIFQKYNLDEIRFSDENEVYKSICNIIDYYEQILSSSKENVRKIPYQNKIKSCLIILKHMSVTCEMMDKVCAFIFKYEFREILINDKILFLNHQIYHRKISSLYTSAIIENRLICYLDLYIDALKNGKSFEVPSTSTNIGFYNLIHYIGPNLSQKRLAQRFNQILKIGLKEVNFKLIEHCFQYMSTSMKGKILRAVKENLKAGFNFAHFAFLVENDVKIEKRLLNELKIYLDIILKSDERATFMMLPPCNPYDDLINVGYWCLLGILPVDEFERYVGYNDCFDFYYLYDKFNFNKFNVAWLLNLQNHIIEKISENDEVKKQICSAITKSINGRSLNSKDEKRLLEILIKFFIE